jgi:hypothetical protein
VQAPTPGLLHNEMSCYHLSVAILSIYDANKGVNNALMKDNTITETKEDGRNWQTLVVDRKPIKYKKWILGITIIATFRF